MYWKIGGGKKCKTQLSVLHPTPFGVSWQVPQNSVDNIRLINLKGKEFVFCGSKNSNWTDCTLIERLF
jgi:hypothetical protein